MNQAQHHIAEAAKLTKNKKLLDHLRAAYAVAATQAPKHVPTNPTKASKKAPWIPTNPALVAAKLEAQRTGKTTLVSRSAS